MKSSRRPKDLDGLALVGVVPRTGRVELEPGRELGWLTVIGPSAGDKRYTKFRCRCGVLVIRRQHSVMQHWRAGATARCDECNKQHKRELFTKAAP